MLYSWISEIAGQIGVLHDFTISDPIVVQTAKVFLSANGEGFSEGQDCEKMEKVSLCSQNYGKSKPGKRKQNKMPDVPRGTCREFIFFHVRIHCDTRRLT